MPFSLVDDQGWQVTAWTRVYLGGLLQSGPLPNLFIAANRRASAEALENPAASTPFNRLYGRPFVFERVFQRGMVTAIAYNAAWQANAIRPEGKRPGFEVTGVHEVTVGARDLEKARLTETVELLAGGERYLARVARTFASVRASDIVVLIDSYGQASVAVNAGSAAEVLGLAAGEEIRIRRLG
jgi:hypothetical protein